MHAHPPTATGFATSCGQRRRSTMPEWLIRPGIVPLAYGAPAPELTRAGISWCRGSMPSVVESWHETSCYCRADLDQKAHEDGDGRGTLARIALVTHQLGQQKLCGGADAEKLVVAGSQST